MPVEFIKIIPGKKARVRIVAATLFMGQHLDEGKVVEVPIEEAHQLVAAQKAEFYIEPVKAPEKAR